MNVLPDLPIDDELALLRAGKMSAACAKIVELHGPLVKSACRRVLRDEGLAEDAAQETFVLLMKKAPALPPGISLAGWLYHAACRTALNHQRAATRRRMRENSVEAINQMIPDTQPNPWAEIEPHLDAAMLALPARQRDLVVQCYFKNQSQRSAAAALGCSESLVSRELTAAIEGLRRFFAKRRVAIGSVGLTGLLSANCASATMADAPAIVAAMMAAPAATTTFMAALAQSKLGLASVIVAGAAAVATAGYYWSPAGAKPPSGPGPGAAFSQKVSKAGGNALPNKNLGIAQKRGSWAASFTFTSAMALDERKKQVLLEADADARYALLQKMGVRLSRTAFDQLSAKGLDASVAPWRNTFRVMTNFTDDFDTYLMAWSNEDPLAALDGVTAQPDGGIGLRRQLLYVLAAQQLQPEDLRAWMGSLKSQIRQKEVMQALEWMNDPAGVVAQMGTGDNDGFLVDLALLQGGPNLDWAAFGRKLASGKSAIVARAMGLVMDESIAPQHLDLMIQELARSSDPNISVGAVAILRAARGDSGADYAQALQLAEICARAGMSDFSARVLQGWGWADPEAALQYTARLKDLAGMRHVLRGLTTLPDEATLIRWMAGTPERAQDIAVTMLYGRTSQSTFSQLQKIMQSTAITDQVEAVKEVMRTLPLADALAAAQWLKQLPQGTDRQELALALARQLAAVDPQATLDLLRTEGLHGTDNDKAVADAVTQYAAQNDLMQSTQFIQQITDPKLYAEALGQIAMVKFPGHPREAFAFLQANSHGDWQPAALRMLSELYYNKLGNIDANAAEILKLDLQRLGPEVAQRTGDFCRIWIDHQAPFDVPLAWTQQLPGNIGPETRLQLARNNALKRDAVAQFQAWAQTAPISPAERSKLQTVLAKRLEP